MQIVTFPVILIAAAVGFALAFIVPIRAFGSTAGFRVGVAVGSLFAIAASLLTATVIAGHLSVAGPAGIVVGLFLGCFLGALIVNCIAGGVGLAAAKIARRSKEKGRERESGRDSLIE
jgi:hypothetical protein